MSRAPIPILSGTLLAAALVLTLWPAPTFAQTSGGSGGSSGGAGGTSSATGAGGTGGAGNNLPFPGGGGGAGATGGDGGDGGSSPFLTTGGLGGSSAGAGGSAGAGSSAGIGGGGGGGGAHGAVVTTTTTNSGTVTGGGGGTGGSTNGGAGGGGGGAGGYGVVVNGSGLTYTNSGTISGASGGAGGGSNAPGAGIGGNGGDGGYGVYFTGSGTLDNSGSITAGAAGAAGAGTNGNGNAGTGGVGVIGGGLTIINSGTISGGSGADAIDFTGGTNTLTLQNGSTITGNIEILAGTLEVDGTLGAGSTVTVAGCATLDGTGTIEGNVVLLGGATLGAGLTVEGTVTRAALTVTTLSDVTDTGATCTGGGTCSLRDALNLANTNGTGDIAFASSLTSASSPGTVNLSTSGGGTNTPLPAITGVVSIAGPGANQLTVSGGDSTSVGNVFTIDSGAQAAVCGITVTGGSSTSGGSIVNNGTLTVTGSTISSNPGGGISNNGTLTVTNSTISGNSVGGGITNGNGATLTVTNSTISGNSVIALGGGIYNGNGATLTVTNSIVSGNTDSFGEDDISNASGIPGEGNLDSTYNGVDGNVVGDKSSVIDLATLGYYGGTTETMPPFSGSPALNDGKYVAGEPTTDQRGAPRPSTAEDAIDSGSVQISNEPPFVAAVTPDSGPIAGGTSVTIAGTGLDGSSAADTAVDFGSGNPAASFSITPATSSAFAYITATSPAGNAGTVDVTVINTYGTSTIGTADQFTYIAPLTLSPTSLSNSDVGLAYNQSITASGGLGAITLTVSNIQNAVPGLNITGNGTSTISITGTPTATGTESFTVTATDSLGATASQNYTIAVTAGAPAILSASGGASQSAYVNVAFATPLTATVTDAYNNPIGGLTVTFTAPATGASATLSASTCTTGTTGSCSVTATANGTTGSYSVTAAVSGLTSVSFALTNEAIPNLVVNETGDDTGTASDCSIQPTAGTTTNSDSCYLRDALLEAAALDTANITFDGAVFTSSHSAATNTITLTSGNTLDVPSNTTIQGATAVINSTLTSLVTVDGGSGSYGNFSVFTVNSGVTGAAIANLTVTDGSASDGGGIVNYGTLAVSNSTVSGNSASGLGGGGIYNDGTLTLTGSTVSGNSATGASGQGGGIYNENGGTLTVTGSTFSGNSGGAGGGIYNDGTLTVSNSTFSGNSATAGGGGAIVLFGSGTLTVTDSVFSGNNAAYGGGIFSFAGTPVVSDSVLTGDEGLECETSAGGGTSCVTNGVDGNVVGFTSAQLAPLGNYGGPTQTMIPLPGSAAICAGSASLVPNGTTTDQRGVAFSAGGYCAAGSVDAGAVQTDYALSFTTEPEPIAPATAIFTSTSFEAAVTLEESNTAFIIPSGVTPQPTLEAISLALTNPPGGVTLSGNSVSPADATGIATFSSLSASGADTDDTLTASLTLNGSLAIITKSSPFSVGAATPTLSFAPSPASQTYGTAITNGTLDALASYGGSGVNGTVAYTTTVNGNPVTLAPGTTVLPVGSYTITATFTPSDTTDYTTASATAGYSVNAAAVTASVTAANRTYNGTTAATITGCTLTGVVAGDSVTCSAAAATFATKNAGTGIAVTATGITLGGSAAGNYTLSSTMATTTANITPAPVTASVTAASKTYNGTTAATITGCTLTGVLTADSGNVTCSATGAAFASGSVGTGIAVTATGITLSGSAAGNYALTSTTATTTASIAAAGLSIAANNATRIYGAANPAFTGTVTGQQNGDTFTESFATTATISSPVGSYAIVPSVTGTNLADYTQTATNGTLTVTQAASAISLSASSTSITPGQSVTLTATVTDASLSSTGSPTGTVSFYDGTTLLDTATLSGGAASYSTTALAAASSNSITAVYSGDENFTGSSASAAVSVVVAPLAFTMTLTGPGSATVEPGGTVIYQVKVSPSYGSYAGTVNFTVAGLPSGAVANFSPASIPANGGPQTVIVTITFPATSATNHPPSAGQRLAPFSLALLLLPFAGALRKRGRNLAKLVCLLLLAFASLAATAGLSGCGSANGYFAQPQKSYDVTITATAGNLTQTATFTVAVE